MLTDLHSIVKRLMRYDAF